MLQLVMGKAARAEIKVSDRKIVQEAGSKEALQTAGKKKEEA